jgi:PhzF family phenazine biosynthesis protein
MKLPLYQVDAFTSSLFHGNPAAICPLDEWLPDSTLQSIAAENNLAETAYYVRTGQGPGARIELRWFTPGVEVDLCGHATLATAHVMFTLRGEETGSRIVFHTKSGELAVERDGDLLSLDFPARPPGKCDVPPGLVEALGKQPEEILAARDYFCVYGAEEELLALAPNMEKLAQLDRFAVIATAPGTGNCDFVSRFFAPSKGVPEDPVTGSAHCTLIPYWSKRLGKSKMFARQRSPRGGELWCEDKGGRVRISGHAASYLEGTITV